MKKFLSLIYLIMGLSCYAQQGPSIRLDGDLSKYSIPVGTGDRAVVDSGVTISNGTMTVDTLNVTNRLYVPGPLITQDIVGHTINATNELQIMGTNVLTLISQGGGGGGTGGSNVVVTGSLSLGITTNQPTFRFVALTNGVDLQVWSVSSNAWISQFEYTEQ